MSELVFPRRVLETYFECTLVATVRSQRSDDLPVFSFGKGLQGLRRDVTH